MNEDKKTVECTCILRAWFHMVVVVAVVEGCGHARMLTVCVGSTFFSCFIK